MTLVGGLLALVVRHRGDHAATAGRPPRTLAAAAAAVVLLGRVRASSSAGSPRRWCRRATWRIRSLVSASAVMAGVTGAVVGAIFLSSLYLQQVARLLRDRHRSASSCRWPRPSPSAPPSPPRLLGRTSAPSTLIVGRPGRRRRRRAAARRDRRRRRRYAADVLPGFLLLGLGVGPMFVAISVAAMGDVPHEQSGLASGLMMTGHEVGAALGVAALTAVAGDLTTRGRAGRRLPPGLHSGGAGHGRTGRVRAIAVPRQHAHPTGHAPMH